MRGLKSTSSSSQINLKRYPLSFFVPHAFVRLDAMGHLEVVFLAMGAHVLLWLIVLVLLFFLLLASLGFLGFLVLMLAHQESCGYALYESLHTYVAHMDLVGDPLQGTCHARASEILITKVCKIST